MWIYEAFILAAFLTGIYACFLYRAYYFRLITILLGVTLFNEYVFTVYFCRPLHIHLNVAYNVFSLIDMGIWCYIFYKIYAGHRAQKFVLPFAAAIFLYTFAELFFLKGWTVMHIDSFRVYELFIIVLSIVYLYGILKLEYYSVNTDPLFWMCAACILYHSILVLTFTLRIDAGYWKFKNAKEVFFFLQVLTDASYYLLLCCMFISGIAYSRYQKKGISFQK